METLKGILFFSLTHTLWSYILQLTLFNYASFHHKSCLFYFSQEITCLMFVCVVPFQQHVVSYSLLGDLNFHTFCVKLYA